jgi:gamma-glutamyltranspeptidase/glutathione hydrolase
MAPTLVEKDGETVLVLGALGGPRIISGVLQTLYRHLVNGWDIDPAIQAPRLHHQFLPLSTQAEENRFSPEVLDRLRGMGHMIELSPMGRVFAVSHLKKTGPLTAAGDSRGEVGLAGY